MKAKLFNLVGVCFLLTACVEREIVTTRPYVEREVIVTHPYVEREVIVSRRPHRIEKDIVVRRGHAPHHHSVHSYRYRER